MRKYIKSLLFLLTVSLFGVISGSTCSAASEYYFTKEKQTTYNGEEIFVFKDNVTLVDFNASEYPVYPEVKEIIVAEGVTYFNWDLLLNGYFPNVVSVSISSTVSEIYCGGYSFFDELKHIKNITVAEDNSYYSSLSNCLFNKDKTLLIQYPVGTDNTSYTIPDTVTTIKGSAFVNSKNLQNITIGANVESSEIQSICEQLYHVKEFKVSSKNSSYSIKDGVLFNKKGDTLLLYPSGKGSSYRVPSGTVIIDSYAFFRSDVNYIKLPNTVKTVNEGAFLTCFKLISIAIPKSVTKFDIYEFRYLDFLKSIYIEKGNKLYASYEGIIYNAAKTKMILVPKAYDKTALKFPSTLTTLYLWNFNLENVTEITIPKALKEIDIYNDYPKCFDKITLDNGNKYFSLYQGSLYNKDKTELMLFKKQKKAEFPSTLKSLNVFYLRNSGITELIIPPKAQITVWYHSVYDIPTLTKLSVDKNSQYYSMQNSMLLSKDKSILYDVPVDCKSLVIPDTVKSMDTMDVLKRNFESIYISKSFEEASLSFLSEIKTIETIEVDKANTNYTSIDGVMYTKDLKKLICYPINKKDISYVMPDSVNRIENIQYLTGNPNLKSITLSKMLQNGDYKFQMSHSIEEINVNSNNANYKSVEGVLYNKDMTQLVAYPYQKKDVSYTIPDTVKSATGLYYRTSSWFTETQYLVDVISNPYLETIILGKNVETLFETYEENPLWDFKNLKKFEVNKDNPYFSAKDGVLYNKDLSIMYLYPQNLENTELIIPSTMKEVKEKALDGVVSNKYLKKIIVEAENNYFSTDGLTLCNFLGNYKYCTLGGIVYNKVTYHD
ncbi:MAG: hypothetical protein K0R00_2717 [Herbinix sp.]|nr:hypothetical protein [Herbinix sp.]